MSRQRKATSTASPPVNDPSLHAPKPKHFYQCVPVMNRFISKLHAIRRKKVYPPFWKFQDAAYKRLARVRLPYKTALLAATLLLIGSVFTPLGVYWFLTSDAGDETEVSEMGTEVALEWEMGTEVALDWEMGTDVGLGDGGVLVSRGGDDPRWGYTDSLSQIFLFISGSFSARSRARLFDSGLHRVYSGDIPIYSFGSSVS